MNYRLPASLLLLLGLAACSAGCKYSYAPKDTNEIPASITMAGQTDSDWSYRVKKINGISTDGQESPQRISPGPTSVDVLISSNELNPLMANFTFTALPNEKYEMRFIAPPGQKEAQTLALADSQRHIVQRLRLGTSESALMVPKLSPAAPAPKAKKSKKK